MSKKVKVAIVIGVIVLGGVFSQALTKNQALLQVIISLIYDSHYQFKPLDDTYSQQVFDLYIERMDPGKRYFTQGDIEEFKGYRNRIDNDLRSGDDSFYKFVNEQLDERFKDIQQAIPNFLISPINVSKPEKLEMDPKKRQFPKDKAELDELWRKIIKYEVIAQYMILVEAGSGTQNPSLKDLAKKQVVTMRPDLEKKAIEDIKKRYKDFFDRIKEQTEDEKRDLFLDTLASVYDNHTNYFPPEQKEDFDIAISGKLEGIGATLSEKDGFIKVVNVVPGSAAWKQGDLKAEDILLKVEQEDGSVKELSGEKVKEAVKYIRGKKGTKVILTVKKPEGKIIRIPLIRDLVVIEATYAKSTIITDKRSQKKIGYITLPKFYRDFQDSQGRNTTDDMRRLIKNLQASGVQGIILDLRENAGGALIDAVETGGLFIETGPIVQVKDQKGQTAPLEDSDPSIVYAGPLVIMINTYSASASEILAAALQDYGRAIVVGTDHSYGKGTVQTIIDLNKQFPAQAALFRPLGSLKLTIQKFYRINGGSTQYKGVIPDIIFPNDTEDLEIGEKYAKNSLPWDTIPPLNYKKWTQEKWNLKEIQTRSKARIAKSPEFEHIFNRFEEVKTYRTNSAEPLEIRAAIKKHLQINEESDRFNAGIVTANYIVFTTPKGEDVSSENGKLDIYKSWQNALAKDSYVSESLMILNEMIEANSRGK